MKKKIITYLVLSVFTLFISCKKQEQDTIEVEEIETSQNSPTKFKKSALSNAGKIEIGVIYTDTVQYVEFNDNYDDFLVIVNKGKDTIALIYNYNDPKFIKGDQLEIKWKIDSLRPAGDPELLDYVEYLISAKKVEENSSFHHEFNNLPLKKLPIIENTSFDNFIKIEGIKNINPVSFSLPLIYKNWYVKEYSFKAISAYRLQLSKDFYTAVIQISIGEKDMEHRLINYNLEGKVINSTRVAIFTDGELEYTTSKSKISQTEITMTNQFVNKDSDYREETHTVIKILPDGNLSELSENDLIFELVAKELKIDNLKRIQHLEVFELQPNNKNEAIVIIPEIVEEGEEYFSLNTNIAIYNIEQQKVTHKYFESHKTNGWVSDAIRLDWISIDIAPYLIQENTSAFGVRVKFIGSSRVNPNFNETLSLYIKDNNEIKNVLHNFSVGDETGEWNGACEGEFLSEKKTLLVNDDKTNGFFDFIVKSIITKTTNFETEIGDCDYNEEIKREISVLKFDGKQYK